MTDEQEKWNQRYAAADGAPGAGNPLLRDCLYLLPTRGLALDLACGSGANAIMLARHGLTVRAMDISSVAIARLAAYASEHQLPITATVRDVVSEPPGQDSYDVIVVCRFLDRSLIPALRQALRPDGLIYYQTFIHERTTTQGPENPDFLLSANELLTLFSGLRIYCYREEGLLGDTRKGVRNEAMLLAGRPCHH